MAIFAAICIYLACGSLFTLAYHPTYQEMKHFAKSSNTYAGSYVVGTIISLIALWPISVVIELKDI